MKLFNGYVVNPLPIFCCTIFVGLALIILPIWATFEIFSKEDIMFLDICGEIETYDCDGPVVFFVSGKNKFSVPFSAIDLSKLTLVIRNKETCKIQYIASEKRESHYQVVNVVSSTGSEIVLHKNVLNAHKKNNIKALIILWGICILYWTTAIISNYIISNAPRYPKLASLLIRKEYRNF